MRRSYVVALVAAFAASACSDNDPTGVAGGPRPGPALVNVASTIPLAQQIDEMVVDFFPKGLETATGARWSTIVDKKATDFEVAKKQFFNLANWIQHKTAEITLNTTKYPDAATKQLAATRLIYAMSLWLFMGPDARLPTLTSETELAIVPAGTEANIVTESEQASLELEAGSTAEDRVFVITQVPTSAYPNICDGPLDTQLCQYPRFYKFESFPPLPLKVPARFAVCLETGVRAPLSGEVHDRLRLAHEAPADPGHYTDGGEVIDKIEILPPAPGGTKLAHCTEVHHTMAPDPLHGGLLARAERAVLLAAGFLGRLLTPQDLHAYDVGPEHYGITFSHFNAVDRYSRPDLSVSSLGAPDNGFAGDPIVIEYSVENRSVRSGGLSAAESEKTTAAVYIWSDQELTQVVAGPFFATAEVTEKWPDDPAQTFSQTITLPDDIPLDATYYVGAAVAPAAGLAEEKVEVVEGALVRTPLLANNSKAVPVRIKKKRPDLMFDGGFSLDQSEVVQGGTVNTSSWTVKNIGNAASGPFDARFYLVSPTDGSDVAALGSAISHESIAHGGSAAHDGVQLAIPTGVAAGAYNVVLRLDPANAVEEFSDANNESAPQALTVRVADVQITLNVTSVEKLPGGTQHFVVQSGGAGPYTWSVKGVDGGTATYGTIVARPDFSADYTAPAAVPEPATFDVCARRQANPSNRACASVTIRPIPSSGADVIVINDLNAFDDTYGAGNPNNREFWKRLATFTGSGPRATQTGVLFDASRQPLCGGYCSINGSYSLIRSTYQSAGFAVTETRTSYPITSVPANIKLLFLVTPRLAFSNDEINVLKQFAAEGGRIVYIGEFAGYFSPSDFAVENGFLEKMGAVMRNVGGNYACIAQLPQSSIRDHELTRGLASFQMACASEVQLGPNDYALFLDPSGTRTLGAVAKVELTLLPRSSTTVASRLGASFTALPADSESSTTPGKTTIEMGVDPVLVPYLPSP